MEIKDTDKLNIIISPDDTTIQNLHTSECVVVEPEHLSIIVEETLLQVSELVDYYIKNHK